jgi:UDP-N-acetylmuramate--alanine ligase
VPFYGVAILCADDVHLRAMLPQIQKRYVTYGQEGSDASMPDLRATDIEIKGRTTNFRVQFRERTLGPFRLNIPGVHNVSNALAAIGVGLELDVPPDLIRAGVASFSGVERRFHIRGEKGGMVIVDDYGHHPTEIRATLAAAKAAWSGRLAVIFQPHRYSRTQDLLDEFANAFEQADILYVTPIYAAGEESIEGVSGEILAERIRATGHPAVHWVEKQDVLISRLVSELRSGDTVLTLGAGDIWKVGVELLELLELL